MVLCLYQVPQLAALFHNDCAHIAAQLLGLPYCYAPGLARLAPSAAPQLVSAAQRLRAAGAQVLDAQVRDTMRASSSAALPRLHAETHGLVDGCEYSRSRFF